jgi:hypothetical protein
MALDQVGAKAIHGGLIRGVPTFLVGTAESPDCENVDPADPFGASTRPGSSLFGVSGGSAGSGVVGRGLFPWIRNAGTTYLFAAHGTTIYSVDTGSWFSVLTGVSTDSIMQGATLNNLAVIVASGVAPKVSTAGSTLMNLGGTPPTLAKYVTTYVQKIFLAGDTANPNTVSFSASNNPEDYTTVNNAGTIIVGDGDGDILKGLLGTKRVCYAFKRNNTYAITGNSPFDFRVDRVAQTGLISEYGITTDGQGVFFASDDGIYYANGLDIYRVSDAIREDYVNISDKTSISLEVKGEKLFCFYASTGSANDKCFVLAFRRKMLSGEVRGVWSRYTAQPYSVSKTAKDNTLYGLTNASTLQIYKLDTGSAGSITTTWNTPDFDFGDTYAWKVLARYFIHVKIPDATTTLTGQWFADGASIGSQYSFTVGTTGSYSILQAAQKSAASITGRFLRLKLSWDKPMTVYGYRIFADTHVMSDLPRR